MEASTKTFIYKKVYHGQALLLGGERYGANHMRPKCAIDFQKVHEKAHEGCHQSPLYYGKAVF